jgi:cell division protease FtsH
MHAKWRTFAVWAIIVLLVLALFTLFQNPRQRFTGQEISFSQMLKEVDQGSVREVTVQGSQINGTFTNGRPFHSYALVNTALLQQLHDKGVSVRVQPPEETPLAISIFASWLPFLALLAVWVWFWRAIKTRVE